MYQNCMMTGFTLRLLLIISLLIAPIQACARPFQSLSAQQRHDLAISIAQAQGRILNALPLAGPDSADEPKAVDLETPANVTVTYWSPRFVISIATPPGEPVVAVLTRIAFPSRGVRVDDLRSLPVKVSLGGDEDCPAAALALNQLQAVIRAATVPEPHARPRVPSSTEFDGGGYIVRIRNGDGAITLSGRDGSPIGRWTAALDKMEPCWRPLS